MENLSQPRPHPQDIALQFSLRDTLWLNHSIQYEAFSPTPFSFCLCSLVLALAPLKPPSDASAPYIETFHRGPKTLVYVAASHHSSLLFPDAKLDPAFRTIELALSQTPPGAVIIEGVDSSQLHDFLGYAKQCAASGYKMPGGQCDEVTLAAFLADADGVPVFSGEPTAAEELAFFETNGYSSQDFSHFGS